MSILRKTRLVQILTAIPSDVNSLFLNLGFRLGAAIAGHIISISSTTGFEYYSSRFKDQKDICKLEGSCQ
jgi:hypothetical protein